jgi:hypothetical protein
MQGLQEARQRASNEREVAPYASVAFFDVKYIETMKAKDADAVAKELVRLNGMMGETTKSPFTTPELTQWIAQRLRILEQLT